MNAIPDNFQRTHTILLKLFCVVECSLPAHNLRFPEYVEVYGMCAACIARNHRSLSSEHTIPIYKPSELN